MRTKSERDIRGASCAAEARHTSAVARQLFALRTAYCALLLFSAACLEPLDPSSVPVAKVIARVGANRSVDTIQVRHTARVYATAYARDGYDIGLTTFTYSSSDEAVAKVDANGTVQAIAPGEATITAKAPQGQSGSVKIVVRPSVIAYTLQAPLEPGAIAFSTDYTRAFVAIKPDSIAVFDALGFFRISTIALKYLPARIAVTSSRVYATHPDVDSVSVVNTASSTVDKTIWVGAGPLGVAAAGNRAFIATQFDRKVVIIENGVLGLGMPVDGEPHELAASIDGKRVFASVDRGAAGWALVSMDPTFADTLGSVPLAGEPKAIATNREGSRVYVLVGSTVYAFASTPSGSYVADGSVAVSTNAGGIAASAGANPYVVVSGDETVILNGETLAILERIPEAGKGFVRVRPDGLFAFISSPEGNVVHVVVL
jgi:YVTN family beta-propeller protein